MNISQQPGLRRLDRQPSGGYWANQRSKNIGNEAYSRRPWQRRLPAVLVASVLLVAALFAAGIPIESTAILVFAPALLVPLLAGLALSK